MGNLIRMDLYRMWKTKGFLVCLILAFVLALSLMPFAKLMAFIAGMLTEEKVPLPETVDLSEILRDPFPLINGMLVMLSLSAFFYADSENGYIKNIAGQMPKKGYTILSKFIAAIPLILLFSLVGLIGHVLGTVFFQKIVVDAAWLDSIRILLLKMLLMLSISSILLLVCAVYQSKSLGSVLAVLMGLGLLSLIYLAIDSALDQVLPNKGFAISEYMPDQLLGSSNPGTVEALAVSLVTIALFLTLSIKVFDHRDIK